MSASVRQPPCRHFQCGYRQVASRENRGHRPDRYVDLMYPPHDVQAVHDAFDRRDVIDRHITEQTAPLVRRMFDEEHAVALHSHTRGYMLMRADTFARTLLGAAAHIEQVSGRRPCAAFRPHAGWRTWQMYSGLKQIDYRFVGWSWMLWDWNWFRARTADSVVQRIAPRVSNGD